MVAGFGSFVVALGLWRITILRPQQRSALRVIAELAEPFEPAEFESHLESLTFAETLWDEHRAKPRATPPDA